MEKLYSSKTCLKMAGGGDASPTSPPPLDSPLIDHTRQAYSNRLIMTGTLQF